MPCLSRVWEMLCKFKKRVTAVHFVDGMPTNERVILNFECCPLCSDEIVSRTSISVRQGGMIHKDSNESDQICSSYPQYILKYLSLSFHCSALIETQILQIPVLGEISSQIIRLRVNCSVQVKVSIQIYSFWHLASPMGSHYCTKLCLF